MDNPVNLNEYPRVEFWTDTKWEPYKEDIQQVIRRHLTTYGEDLREVLEITIDLDEGNEEWMYTAFFSQIWKCPPKSWIPGRRDMTGKANNENLFTKWSHLWICGYQCHVTKRKIRLIRFLTK